MDDPIALLTLAQCSSLHGGMLADYLASATTPAALLTESAGALAALELPGSVIHGLLHPDKAQLDTGAAWLACSPRRSLVVWGSPRYPRLLACITDAPLVL